MLEGATNDIDDAAKEVIEAEDAEVDSEDAHEVFLDNLTDPVLETYHNCQLYREEEINLYYQCT